MTQVREIPAGETWRAAEALRELRPRWGDTLADVVDNDLRPAGYRLVGAFEDGAGSAVSACGFREAVMLAWGHHIYVDDLSTVPAARGRGHADLLMTWVVEEARRLGCEAVHLDSGVGSDRAAAHRLYMRHRFRISSHHFQLDL
ncbi:GNAT family N-acetyltransferase [Mycobacterium hubeiense]|uniref:GNAT family N-acetyltransferase n=1 Tax=Mycobacterium hubeiense TaxID=1867256 RepID=UPI000C7F02FB|nr:GNAT family N-acetyltransferase [Mycobacterium sp. QGD 101]